MILYFVYSVIVFGGENWKRNTLLTALICPGYVSHLL